ncbi:methyltransferase domain-containing protein [Acetobacterium paludosum]|uniref:Methyltransferase domain-containing protein n=1 Tax=Acetobacterium paludosum TaxID=52693 RepID=A0A923KXK9_9FIRM|nr:class I SAM-dependent methyltransferase [Acetobacterium paludosum]MBC3889715.1 methyltransferase domain-containing protein [Acetobacterium paludosum]
MNKTLRYYNNTAKDFIDATLNTNMSDVYQFFLKYIPENASILDLGCGSGRDSKLFIEKGYSVCAMDGSMECCKLASEIIGQEVVCKTFEKLDYSHEFDGIWACASLLHVPFDDMPGIFEKVSQALKPGGYLFASFKYGRFEGERNGRYFTDLNEKSMMTLVNLLKELQLIETLVANDARVGREGKKWLDVILKRPQSC